MKHTLTVLALALLHASCTSTPAGAETSETSDSGDETSTTSPEPDARDLGLRRARRRPVWLTERQHRPER